ncbi:RHS repeat-associated core domain-containing protein (plasmid) [Coraliomargarita sp. W4R53]
MRNRLSVSVVVAIAAVLLPLVVVAPAHGSGGRMAAAPDGVWVPPDDADDARIPDFNVPDEAWAPPAEVRLQQPPDANERGIAPFGAPVGTVAAAPGVGELPWFAFEDFPLSSDATAGVNIANGNLLVKANDLVIPAPGYALRHDRYYNGLSTSPGSLGGGWMSSNGEYDIGLAAMGSYADFYGPNGLKFRFTRVGSTSNFAGPAGSNMSMRENPASGDFRYIVTQNHTGEQFIFALQGWLTQTVDRNGVGEWYTYNSGYMAHAYHDNGRGIILDREWGPNGASPLLGVSDTAGRSVEYTYDPITFALKTVKAADGKITTYNYDSTGRLSSIVLPAAPAATTTVTFTYDSSHRVTKVAQLPGIETTFTYTVGKTVVTDSNGKAATYNYDTAGRVTSTKDALNRTRSQTWTANSDTATSTDAVGTNTTTYTYDGSGNRLSAQLPTGAAASAAYAIGAGCTAPNTGTAFQAKCSTDDAGNKKQYQYDAAGNLTKQTDSNSGTAVTEFERTYGTCGGFAGQVCSTKDGNGNVTTYAYNSNGDLTTVTPPAPLGATTYAHDSLGRVTSVTDGKGDTTSYQYDVRDRIVLTTFEDGQNINSTYYANGLERTRTDSGGGAITYEYNHQGLLTKQLGPRSGVTQTMTYDEVGNLLTYADSSGTTTYTYDAANQLTKLREPGGTCPATGNPAANSGCILFEYNSNGAEIKRILPGGANTVTTRDNSGRPTRITAKTGTGTTAVDIGYAYAPTGGTGDRANVQRRTAHAEQGITVGAITNYSYDSRNRLTLAQEKSGSTVTASWAYTYDNNGNRTKQVRTGSTGATAGNTNYGYNAANQLTSATGQTTTWTYDAAGNQTRAGTTGVAATFGDRGERSTLGSTTGTYFGPGNTHRLSLGTTTFNNGALGLMQATTAGATQQYSRTPEGTPVGFKATNKWYYVQDHLGSVVGIFSSSGTYSGGYSYSPYGEARATGTSSANTANPLRYIGERHDGTGIYKLGARYYDSAQARFTQADPSGQEPNPYAYARCNPANAADPTGLAPNGCNVGMGAIGTLNGILWTTAGLVSWTGAGAAVAAGAGIVTTGIITVASFWCP